MIEWWYLIFVFFFNRDRINSNKIATSFEKIQCGIDLLPFDLLTFGVTYRLLEWLMISAFIISSIFETTNKNHVCLKVHFKSYHELCLSPFIWNVQLLFIIPSFRWTDSYSEIRLFLFSSLFRRLWWTAWNHLKSKQWRHSSSLMNNKTNHLL